MSDATHSAYGRTWPLIVTPRLQASILVQTPVKDSPSIGVQKLELERALRLVLPKDTEIAIELVDELSLSPEDQAEHDRLESAALAA